jgi:hypothetical protein
MNTHTESKLDTFILLKMGIEVSHGIENTQTRSYSSVRIIFVCHWIAEIDEKTIPEESGDMPIVALDNFGTHPLICTHNVTPLFRVELRGQGRRFDDVDEHHRELPTFRVRRKCRRERFNLGGWLCLHNGLWCWLSRLRGDCLSTRRIASPDESSPVIISRWVHVEEFCFEGFEILVI